MEREGERDLAESERLKKGEKVREKREIVKERRGKEEG